jgi:hypothetical protein
MRTSQRRIVDESFGLDSGAVTGGQRRAGATRTAAPAAFESLEGRMLLSGTAADAVTTTPTTGATVDAAAATGVKTDNGGGNDGGFYVDGNGKLHFHGKFQWV